MSRPPRSPDSSGVSSPDRRPDVVVLAGVRTGFGAFGGALKDHSATELGVVAARAALERAAVPP
jgi:acetyl-CoA acetyltransferase